MVVSRFWSLFGRLTPLRIAATYIAFATIWIILSDRAAMMLASSAADEAWFQTLKGLFFVTVTGFMLLFLMRRLSENIEKSREAELVSANRFRMLFDTSPDGVAICDPATGTVIECNSAFNRMLGVAHPGDQPVRLADIEANESAQEVRAHIDRVLESGSEDFHTRWRRVDGEIIEVSVRVQTVSVAGRTVLYSICRDLTERRSMEQRMAESEDRLKLALEAADLATWDADLKTGELRHSARVAEMFGLPAQHRIPTLAARMQYIHPDDREKVLKAQEVALATGERYLCDARVVHPDGAVRWISARAHVLRDEQGVGRRVIGVLADITDRKLAEESLRKSEELYRLASRSVSDIIWDWDVPADRLLWSEGARALTDAEISGGFAIADWLGQIHVGDRERVRAGFFEAVKGAAVEWRDEYRFILTDGSTARFKDRAFIIRDASGRAMRMVGAMNDVSAEHNAREQLVASELRYRLAAQAVSDTIWDWDIAGDRVTKSGRLDKFSLSPTGFTHSVGDFADALHPEDREAVKQSLAEALASDETHWFAEYRHRLRGGTYGVFTDRGYIVRDADGKPLRMVGAMTDVTAQREAEAALRANEERLSSLISHSPLAVIEWDAGFKCVRWSGQSDRIFGWKSEEIVGRHFGDWRFVHEDDAERIAVLERELIERRGSFNTIVSRNYDKAGRVLTCEWHNANLYDRAGERIATISLVSDVTQREAMLGRLAESEERFRRFAEAVDTCFWIRAIETGDYLYMSPAMHRLLGVAPDKAPQNVVEYRRLIHPDDLAATVGAYDNWIARGASGPLELENRIILPSGAIRWWRNRVFILPDPGGTRSRIAGITEDVTARHAAAEALSVSEERFRRLAETIDQSFWIRSVATGEYFYQSPAANRILGVAEDRLPRTISDYRQLVVPEDRAKLEREVEHWKSSGFAEPLEIEYRVRRPDGQVRWWRSRAYALAERSGPVGRIAGVTEDVTERRTAEEALRQSEVRFRQLAGAIDQVFWMTAQNPQRVLYASPAFERVYGISHAELYAKPDRWQDAIHSDDRQAVRDSLRSWIAGGCDGAIENKYRVVLPDGRVRWVLDRGQAVRDESGNVLYQAGIADDITERELDEQTIRRSLEVQRMLLQELDHRVKNALAGLLTMISLCAQSERSVAGLAGAMQRRVTAMASIHEMLSSQRWAGLDIRDLIATLTPIEHTTAVAARGESVRVSPRQATPLGIVLQELFSNSLKYGALSRAGGRIAIAWSAGDGWPGQPGGAGNEPTLEMHWVESGGPAIEHQPEPGLGTSLVQGFARSELRGEALLSYPRGGASHTIRIRLDPDGGSPVQRDAAFERAAAGSDL